MVNMDLLEGLSAAETNRVLGLGKVFTLESGGCCSGWAIRRIACT